MKKEIDEAFVEKNIQLEELEVKRNVKETFDFNAVIKPSQSTTKIKKALNHIGKVTWFIVISGTAATRRKKLKKWVPPTRKVGRKRN